jgi:hypothetical protein
MGGPKNRDVICCCKSVGKHISLECVFCVKILCVTVWIDLLVEGWIVA